MTPLQNIVAASLAVLGISVAHGANVSLSTLAGGATAKKIVTVAGADLPANSVIRVGFFNLGGGDPTVVLSGASFSALQAMFKPIGEDAGSTLDGTNSPIVTNASGAIPFLTISGVDDAWYPDTPPTTRPTPLYIWAFAQPTADATATQWAIFRDPNWVMPLGIAGINLQTAQIDQASEVFAGSLNSNNNTIVMVPEPGSALLGLIGLGLALRRRRG